LCRAVRHKARFSKPCAGTYGDGTYHTGMSSPGRSWIVDSIGAEAFERLATELTGSELQSLLLEVLQRRARRRGARELSSQYESDSFCLPAAVDQRTSVAIDQHLLAAAESFEAIELSPVAPLGACSALGLTDQNRVLSALRATEVVSDPTNVLALECARRLRARPGGGGSSAAGSSAAGSSATGSSAAGSSAAVHLVTSQRVLRAQPIPKLPGYARHFRMLALASGGTESKDHAFSVETLLLHIRTALACLDRLEQHGYGFGERSVDVLATEQRRALGARVVAGLGTLARSRPLEHRYYSAGLRYQVWVTAPDGARLPLIDGGAFDWLAQLTSNRRAVFVATGLGAQLIALRFSRRA